MEVKAINELTERGKKVYQKTSDAYYKTAAVFLLFGVGFIFLACLYL